MPHTKRKLKTRAAYEAYLNDLYGGEPFEVVRDYFEHLKLPDDRLLSAYSRGRLGSLKRMREPMVFERQYQKWATVAITLLCLALACCHPARKTPRPNVPPLLYDSVKYKGYYRSVTR